MWLKMYASCFETIFCMVTDERLLVNDHFIKDLNGAHSFSHDAVIQLSARPPPFTILLHQPRIVKLSDVSRCAVWSSLQALVFGAAKCSMPAGLIKCFRFCCGDTGDGGFASASAHWMHSRLNKAHLTCPTPNFSEPARLSRNYENQKPNSVQRA
ncbi:hypothetical protein ALP10_200089 [Pseudomonas syringae pv. helianthi]|uniref:Uncharacterized protein n=1 Tax=Pseudomonas syringae pv. helianthi TaxID=251654 RepID=A0A3M6CG96_9PSED|nr:hypothetical protein ALP10_200089 [Pseudomonas syringae pv. helianthi]